MSSSITPNATIRAGKRWTPSEEKELFDELKNGKTYEEISQTLGRSVGGIKIRAIDLALSTLAGDMTPREMSEFIKIPYEDLVKRANLNCLKPSAKTKESSEKLHNESSNRSFEILWKFKIFLKSKIQFDEDMHNYFDEFVKNIGEQS